MFHIHCIQYFFLKGGGPDFSISGGEGKTGFPNWGRLVGGGQFGQNGQKLHENDKIGILGSKQWGGGHRGGQANFSGSGGDLEVH